MTATTPKSTLLVVDDEIDILDFVERVFRREYRVLRAQSGEEALLALTREHVDVLLTDQRMPHMSGWELLARLSGRYPVLVKVLLSGYSDAPEIDEAMASGEIHGYALKPVDSTQLTETLHAARARHARGEGGEGGEDREGGNRQQEAGNRKPAAGHRQE